MSLFVTFLFTCMCMCANTHSHHTTCKKVRGKVTGVYSFSTTWVLGIQLKSSGQKAGALTH